MIFYAIGIGPGEPELMTLQAFHRLEKCPVIFCPQTKNGDSVALSILNGAGLDLSRKTIIKTKTPMIRDEARLSENYAEIAAQCAEFLRAGSDVAFITLGDVSFYSTAAHIAKKVGELGFSVEFCAGITSISAAAAKISMNLAERDEEIVIIPADSAVKNGILRAELSHSGTKILMKLAASYRTVIETLFEMDIAKNSVLFQNCGLSGERILHLKDFSASSAELYESQSYFSLVIIK